MTKNEVALSQCPLCGSVTDPDAVDDGIKRQNQTVSNSAIFGFFLGALGMALLVLFFGTNNCPGILN